jgi:hypothetical protein
MKRQSLEPLLTRKPPPLFELRPRRKAGKRRAMAKRRRILLPELASLTNPVSKASRFAFSVNEPPSIWPSNINAMRHARPPSLRYGAPSSCGQHSQTTWPRRRPCGVGLTAGKAGRFTYWICERCRLAPI